MNENKFQPSIYDLAYEAMTDLLPSEKVHHLNALMNANLLDRLTMDQIIIVVHLMQNAYRNGKRSMGAEKIDNDLIWINGIGGIENMDGKWLLTMPETYLTSTDMAKILGVSVRRVRALAARRKIGQKIGRSWLFEPQDIEKLRPGKPGRRPAAKY